MDRRSEDRENPVQQVGRFDVKRMLWIGAFQINERRVPLTIVGEFGRIIHPMSVSVGHPRKKRTAVVAVILFVPLLLLTGCSLFDPEPVEFTTTQSYGETFKTVRDILGRRYVIETADPEKGLIRTKWKVIPSEMKTKRFRIITHVSRSGSVDGGVTVKLRSDYQEVSRTLTSYKHESADWDDASRNLQQEEDLLSWIESQLQIDEREEQILDEVERGQKRDRRLEELKRKQGPPPGEDSS